MIHNNQKTITIQNPDHSLLKESINIPENCSECRFHNFKINGLMQNKTLSVSIRCMKCGKINQEINHKPSLK